MGSPCELTLYAESEKQAKSVTQLLMDELKRLEEKYTRFNNTSVTSTINQGAGNRTPVKLDEETAHLIHYAGLLYEQSDGLFDISSGVLRKIWNFKSDQIPSEESVQALLPIIGWNKIEWKDPYFRLPYTGMQIDFGGFVKEYAADVLATLCLDNAIEHGLINLGGDIRVVGPHPDGEPWRVGIRHPREPNTAIAAVDILSGAIASSGDYERYMIVDGKRYSHLLNPLTGQSIQPAYASVSVVADTCLLAGSCSSIAMLKSQDSKGWLEELGLPYLAIDQTLELFGSLSSSRVL